MRKKILMAASAAALAATAIAGVAFAQGQATPPNAPQGGRLEMLFQADANRDNVVTRQEFDAGHGAKFAQADANRDGSLSREEMRTMHPRGERGAHGDHHGHGRTA